jgi:hypothetical protein
MRKLIMKKLVIVFTTLIIVLSLVVSIAGILSYGQDGYQTITTARGETLTVQDAGVYRYSPRAFVTAGIPWDFARLFIGIPILVASFVFFLRGSLRGTALFIGSLASLLYQYLLWTFGWAFNGLFLVYVAAFSLSLCTLVLVLAGVDLSQVRAGITPHFPVITTASFSFAMGAGLLFKCLGEIVPTIGTNAMPTVGTGFYTMVDQALDLGLLVPLTVLVGILVLRREPLGYLLSASTVMLGMTIGLSVVVGEITLGLSSGRINTAGIAMFAIFLGAGLMLLTRVLMSMKQTEKLGLR